MKFSSFALIGVFSLVLLFQNCSQQQFGPKKGYELLQSMSLDSTESGGSDLGSQEDILDNETIPVAIVDDEDDDKNDKDDDDDKVAKDDDDDKDKDDDKNDKDDDDDKIVKNDDDQSDDRDCKNRSRNHKGKSDDDKKIRTEREAAHYVCILEGAGKSARLGLVSGDLKSLDSAQKNVCMTKSACEGIVAQKFSVKEAAYRGYCKQSSDHAVPLTEAEIRELLDI